MTRPALPPDDDPLFDQWVRDIGSMQDLPDPDVPVKTGRPVVAAVTLVAALFGFGVALGIATALAFGDMTSLPIALVLMAAGTLLAGGALAYLLWRVP